MDINVEEKMNIVQIPLEEIHAHPLEPRSSIDLGPMENFRENIKANGLINPITVTLRPEGGYYRLAGQRRQLACEDLGYQTIAANLREGLSESEIQAILLAENLHREDLPPLDEADTFARFLETQPMAELLAFINREQSYVQRRLKLRQLSDAVRKKLRKKEIPLAVAEQLACLPAEKQGDILSLVEDQKLNAVQLSNLLMQQKSRELKMATFDTEECLSCIHNSAGQADLFAPEVTGLGHCLNADCWRIKERTKGDELIKQIEAMGPRAVLTEKQAVGIADLPPDVDATQSLMHNGAELGESNLADCQSCQFLVVFVSARGHLLQQNICTQKTCYQERSQAFRKDNREQKRTKTQHGKSKKKTPPAQEKGTPTALKMTAKHAPSRVKEFKRKRYDAFLKDRFVKESDENILRLAFIAMSDSTWSSYQPARAILKELSGQSDGEPFSLKTLELTRGLEINALMQGLGRLAAHVIEKLPIETVEQMIFIDLKHNSEALFSVEKDYLSLLTKVEIEATIDEIGLAGYLDAKGRSLKKLANKPKASFIEGILNSGFTFPVLPKWLKPETLQG